MGDLVGEMKTVLPIRYLCISVANTAGDVIIEALEKGKN
jgi:hypothetical protein